MQNAKRYNARIERRNGTLFDGHSNNTEYVMAFGSFKSAKHIEVKVKKVYNGMDIILDNTFLKGKGEDGDYQIYVSFDNMEFRTVRRLPGLINELEGMGFEYTPRKRVYRR